LRGSSRAIDGQTPRRRAFFYKGTLAIVRAALLQGGDVDAGLAELGAPAKAMIDDLLWWTAALKTARAATS
jgi:hypothetical protein